MRRKKDGIQFPSSPDLLALTETPMAQTNGVQAPVSPASSASPGEEHQGRPGSVRKRIKRQHYLIALVFLLPSVLGFLVYSVAPIGYGLYISFTKYIGFGTPVWSGLSNYDFLLHDAGFWYALIETILLTIVIVPLSLAVPLILALLLNEGLPLQGLLRVIFFLPSAVPWVASALLFQDMFAANGMINELLRFFHLPTQDWIYATSSASNLMGPLFWLVVILSVWKSYGLGMLIYLAGLQGIPSVLYEAAMIDGAGPWQRFRSITLPGLAPVTFFVLVTSFISALQTFTPVYLLGQGGSQTVNGVSSGSGITTVAVYAYNTAFVGGYYGYGSAILWGLFVVMFGFTLIQFRILQRGTRRKEALV
jgi:multiple sugar transport system permease protein